MTISFQVEDVRFSLPERQRFKKWIRETVEEHGKKVGEIGYLFCSDEYILEANRTYLDHDTYTDIITFDYVEGNIVSGDILISIDRVRDNAEQFGVPFEQELRRVVIHGVHHLLGQGDKSPAEAAEMRQREDASLLWWERQDSEC
ncbi:MAG: rRNA maturation RNase YbeY [Bacteroidales bacterium]|nr:rRNA maturation RNase YbeY [Bacteroidales bacterium]MBQ9639912.1 rRNA maturation RNase YbeY [Bacteroidales bacterium]